MVIQLHQPNKIPAQLWIITRDESKFGPGTSANPAKVVHGNLHDTLVLYSKNYTYQIVSMCLNQLSLYPAPHNFSGIKCSEFDLLQVKVEKWPIFRYHFLFLHFRF